MSTEFTSGLEEAQDISMFLNPLRRHFETMEEVEYLELPQRFMPLFHCICLVWANCAHYRRPARLVVLLQEICNLLIELVTRS